VIKARFGSNLDSVVLRLLPFVARLRVHPNTLTFLGVVLSLAAAGAFATGRLIPGGFLMGFAGLCDLLDGVVARSQGTGSRAGAFFDSTMDRVSDLLIFGGLAVWYGQSGNMTGLILSLWAVSGAVMTSYVRARAEAMLPSLHVGIMERGERFVLILVGAATGFMQTALSVVALGATITSVQRLLLAYRLISELPEAVPADAEAAREKAS
jgi:CDP-diacylglycerol--glycerol-3-phosphate 3-phosphatidyltransferase